MIQRLHFLSGPTLLLINYLIVNFSMMHKCAINQKVAKEKRRNRIRNEEMMRAKEQWRKVPEGETPSAPPLRKSPGFREPGIFQVCSWFLFVAAADEHKELAG